MSNVDDLVKMRNELNEQIREAKINARRTKRSPVRLGQTKAGEDALLISPPARNGAPTKITREVAQVLVGTDWNSVLQSFANGESLDPEIFSGDDDSENETE